MDDVQVLCDLEIDMQPHPIPDGKGSFLLMPTCLGMAEKGYVVSCRHFRLRFLSVAACFNM